jgi:hypothetical protein
MTISDLEFIDISKEWGNAVGNSDQIDKVRQ